MNQLFKKLIAMGVTDSEEAWKIIAYYKKTGILTKDIK